jgi:hypothetical protein
MILPFIGAGVCAANQLQALSFGHRLFQGLEVRRIICFDGVKGKSQMMRLSVKGKSQLMGVKEPDDGIERLKRVLCPANCRWKGCGCKAALRCGVVAITYACRTCQTFGAKRVNNVNYRLHSAARSF